MCETGSFGLLSSRKRIHYGVIVYRVTKLRIALDFYKKGVSKLPNHPTNFFHLLRFFQYSLFNW